MTGRDPWSKFRERVAALERELDRAYAITTRLRLQLSTTEQRAAYWENEARKAAA